MRAEPLPQPLVAPLAEQVQIELPEHGRAAHAAGSSSRSMPTIGIVAQLRAVPGLVAELVDELLELEQREQPVEADPARRQEPLVRRREVPLEERVAARVDPALGRLDAVEQERRVARVGERAGHPGEVAERGALAPPLGQRAGGLALEVDHDPVAVGRPEHLAEVVVAVRPDREPGGADGGELLDEVAEVLGAVRDGAERVVLGQRRERRRDLLVDLGREQAERLGARLLGREVRVGVVARRARA